MEEVTREIALSLSIKTILISILAAGITIAIAALLKPAILIARDLMAWKLIEKNYFNEKERVKIERLHRLKKRLATQFTQYADYEEDQERTAITSAIIDGHQVSPHYGYIHDDTKTFIEQEVISLEESTSTKKVRLTFILQHLGMTEIDNPLENIEKKYSNFYKEKTPREIKIDYDWSEDEALKEIKKHI